RALATRQAQQVQSHLHTSLAVGVGDGSLGPGQSSYALYGSGTTGLSGGTETRPVNTSYLPRIHA
ncbi:phage tail protein, partial [Achromobacter ruhlandii]